MLKARSAAARVLRRVADVADPAPPGKNGGRPAKVKRPKPVKAAGPPKPVAVKPPKPGKTRPTPVYDAGSPYEVVHVDPRRIVLVTAGLNSEKRPADVQEALRSPEAVVLDGDWDLGAWDTRLFRFDELPVHQAFRHRFLEGGRWEDTPFYARVVRQMERGTPAWGCTSEEQFRARLTDKLEPLYRSIAEDGYRTQVELGTRTPWNEIRVGIRRDGRLLFFDGRHRLSIARVLGLESVPVNVVARHPEWVAFLEEVHEYVDRRLKGRLYQAIDHPDLARLPARHDTQRVAFLHRALGTRDWSGSTLLDVGTHWGFMCQEMEKLGFACTGIEHNPAAAEFARRLAPATESSYEVWQGNLLEHPGGRFDVVFALSILHHMCKTEERHEQLKAFLARLDTDLMIFEPHDPVRSAKQMEGAFRNYEPEEFVAFVAEHAGLPNVEYVGTPADNYRRPLYKLTR